MDRRQFASASVTSLAGVVLAGTTAFADTDKKCVSTCNPPPPPWHENSITTHLRSQVKPPMDRVKESRRIDVLSTSEWHTLAANFAALGDAYSRLGNMHHLDLAAQARQAELRKKFGNATVDLVLKDGFHMVWSQAARHYSNIPTAADRENECKGREAIVMALDIGAFLQFYDPVAVALFFTGSLILSIANYIQC